MIDKRKTMCTYTAFLSVEDGKTPAVLVK